ncbi:MAG: multicopper oxidase domain-containing protein [Steroidobacteraceae bacterium]
MRQPKLHTTIPQFLALAALALCAVFAPGVEAAVPGITGPAFNLAASEAYTSQPDGTSVYGWGYGCNGTPAGFEPAAIAGAVCSPMQQPGPTLIVHQGDAVRVTLTNNLPAAAGNTSILFTGFTVATDSADAGVAGLLTSEAPHGGTVTYTFTATTPGTHSYYSGTQGDLQIEMGLYGAIVVIPSGIPSACTSTPNDATRGVGGISEAEFDFRLAAAAYDNASACYDREYLFQFSEIDLRIHREVEQQVLADAAKPAGQQCTQSRGCLTVDTEPYHAAYFLINGRSMPDDMDPNYALQYPHQPYNGNPHMHPGELVLLRVIGTGRLQHPFHEHGNHVRILARDGNLIVSQSDPTKLAGPLLFTTTTTPGLAMDGIFYWTGKGLNWDVFGHTDDAATVAAAPTASAPCEADGNGYYTSDPAAPNYYEWCADHNRALESKPTGFVGSGGPVSLPDANILAGGAWYGGSPYLGGDATIRAVNATPIPPSGTVANGTDEAGFAFMWHSHNERELTTNNAFPGGMMMMMLVDPRAFVIDEKN